MFVTAAHFSKTQSFMESTLVLKDNEVAFGQFITESV